MIFSIEKDKLIRILKVKYREWIDSIITYGFYRWLVTKKLFKYNVYDFNWKMNCTVNDLKRDSKFILNDCK